MNLRLTLEEVLLLIPEAESEGDAQVEEVVGIASLESAQAGDLSFLGNAKYKSQVEACKASLILLPADYSGKPKPDQMYLRMKEPSRGLAAICRHLEERVFPPPPPTIHETACVHPEAVVAEGVSIGPFCHVGSRAIVG